MGMRMGGSCGIVAESEKSLNMKDGADGEQRAAVDNYGAIDSTS
jgi:hypothetical protein